MRSAFGSSEAIWELGWKLNESGWDKARTTLTPERCVREIWTDARVLSGTMRESTHPHSLRLQGALLSKYRDRVR
jgi:hypothetical protein